MAVVVDDHRDALCFRGTSPHKIQRSRVQLNAFMLATHLANRRVEVRNVRRPQRPEGFALIRLLLGGICNTDLELQRGYYGFSGTPGHEFVGEVVAADDSRLVG